MKKKEKSILLESSIKLPRDQEAIKKFLKLIPNGPGVYKFLDQYKVPVYIGKAKSLNKRVPSYFRESSKTKKIKNLLKESLSLEFSLTNTELESLLLEQFLIKEHKPKYNVQFKDDKGYPWIKLSSSKAFPSATSFLGRKDNINKYFGPFPNSFAVRDALKLVQRMFKLRNCSDGFFKNRTRPCLQYEIGRCSAPCVNFINKEDYNLEVLAAEDLLSGRSDDVELKFYSQMDKFSLNKDYEKAAIYRDRISALRDIQRDQSIAGYKQERHAVVEHTEGEVTKIGLTRVKGGWVTSHENFTSTKNLEGNIIENFIESHYFDDHYCPPIIVTDSKIDNKLSIERALSKFHKKNVRLVTKPSSRDKGLLKISKSNLIFSFEMRRRNKSLEHKTALSQISTELEIAAEIKIIESYDVSHHSGDYAVAGCVVYSESGKEKDKYRTYNISDLNAGNDIGSMLEVIKRRFKKTHSNPLPDLIILDGGKTHLNKVKKILLEMGLNISIISISKGVRRKADFDTIHLTSGKSLKLNKRSIAHLYIQEIRDETHRFSLSSQARKKRKSSLNSSIDYLNGVGEKRKKNLLRYFGSVEQLRRASENDISKVPGIGRKTASKIFIDLK